jgi:hypothetical protein
MGANSDSPPFDPDLEIGVNFAHHEQGKRVSHEYANGHECGAAAGG